MRIPTLNDSNPQDETDECPLFIHSFDRYWVIQEVDIDAEAGEVRMPAYHTNCIGSYDSFSYETIQVFEAMINVSAIACHITYHAHPRYHSHSSITTPVMVYPRYVTPRYRMPQVVCPFEPYRRIRTLSIHITARADVGWSTNNVVDVPICDRREKRVYAEIFLKAVWGSQWSTKRIAEFIEYHVKLGFDHV